MRNRFPGYNSYGNDIGYADATEMVSWCEGNLTLLFQKTKKLLWAFIGCHRVSPNIGACAFKFVFTVDKKPYGTNVCEFLIYRVLSQDVKTKKQYRTKLPYINIRSFFNIKTINFLK